MTFETNVFINCPFDEDYKTLLKPLLFTVLYCGFDPQISETLDSGRTRVQGIANLIEASKYSIHDLSRMEAAKAGDLARFNMPFELGLDLGCRRFKGGEHTDKRCLILDKEKYRYQKVISDLSGNDIAYHKEDPEVLIREVRNWLFHIKGEKLTSGKAIWNTYNEFLDKLDEVVREENYSKEDLVSMPWSEYKLYVREWIIHRKARK